MVKYFIAFILLTLLSSCAYIMHCDHYFLDEVQMEGLRSKKYYKRYSEPDLELKCLRPYAAYVRRISEDTRAQRRYPSDTGFLVVKVFYPGSRVATWDVQLEYNQADFDMNKSIQGYYSGHECDDMEIINFTTINCGQFHTRDLEQITDSSFAIEYGNGRYSHYVIDNGIPIEWFSTQEPDWH